MGSLAAPQTRNVAASILFFAALASSPLGLSQRLFEPVARDARQAEIVERIREEQAKNGSYSAALVEPFMALSFLYRETGDRGLAIAAIERALQVQRANYGLRTLDQVPLIRQWIETAEAMGNYSMAWDLEQALIALAQKNPDDLRAVTVFREIGDERMDLLRRYIKGEEFPPQIILGCYYDRIRSDGSLSEEQRHCYSGSRRSAIQAILAEAQGYYLDAIGVMQHNRLYSSDELRDLEMQLVRTSYLHGHDPDVGKESLRRLLSYDEANAAPQEVRVESLVRMADWDLMFANGRSQSDAALATYEAAYRELEESGASEDSLENVFTPEMPVVLPSFMPNPLASEETPDSKGYIDVAFEIGKYGKSAGVSVIGSTNNVTDATKKNLVRTISRSTFRPRLTDGHVAENSPVVVRYYFND